MCIKKKIPHFIPLQHTFISNNTQEKYLKKSSMTDVYIIFTRIEYLNDCISRLHSSINTELTVKTNETHYFVVIDSVSD